MVNMRRVFLVALACATAAYGQVAPDCSGEEWGANCASPNYREFCDADGSILSEELPKSICAPVSALQFLVGKVDYCGKCKPAQEVVFDALYPSQAPSDRKSTRLNSSHVD